MIKTKSKSQLKNQQLKMSFDSKLSPEVKLPSTNFDLIEQLAIALQNRDERTLRQLIYVCNLPYSTDIGKTFVSDFIIYCNKMDKKYNGVYVHTVPGCCVVKWCNKGVNGLGVSLNTTLKNKTLWKFNIIAKQISELKLEIQLCLNFVVDHEEIPF